MRKTIVLTACMILAVSFLYAKRMAPELIDPVKNDKYVVTAPNACHWHNDPKTKEFVRPGCCFMGGIHVYDRKTKDLIWRTRVYEVKVNPCVELDVQEVYITKMELKGDILTVTNEKNFVYEVDLKNKKIKAVKGDLVIKNRFADESDKCDDPFNPEISEQGTACDQEEVKKIK